MTLGARELLIERAEDVYALRQRGRVAAAAVGRDDADQVRLSTALSELGRDVLAHGGTASALFRIDTGGALVIEIKGFPLEALTALHAGSGIEAARRLVDRIDVRRNENDVTLLLRMPAAPGRRNDGKKLDEALSAAAPLRPLDELRLQNRDLIVTLNEIREQQEQLLRLNGELAETNRGVMAMYGELSDELEETNRGVVALYADLDDKSVQLNAANEAKSRFLASVSHELRSPVSSILGLVRILAEPEDGTLSNEQAHQLALMRSSATELLTLVNTLLDLSKAESGRLEPEVTRFELPPLLGELRGALRPLVPAGVQFVLGETPDVTLESDRMLLGQVLRNLLVNALKFTVQGEVRLACERSSSYDVAISVHDTGIGIAAEDQGRVFEEFYQVRGPLQQRSKGTGLGLPYARRVAEALGGRLELRSEIGRGSTFTIRLPLVWELLGMPRTSETESVPPCRVESALIVDDDAGLRTALRGMLQGLAAQVQEARGGIEGLEMMEAAPPSIVFLDLRMPDLEGTEVLAEMRRRPELRDLPVVIVSSAEITSEDGIGAVTSVAKATLTRDAVARAIIKATAGGARP